MKFPKIGQVAGSAALQMVGADAQTTNGDGQSVNLKGGDGDGTGSDGEVKINDDANLCFAVYRDEVSGNATDRCFFVAPRALRVKSIVQVHSVAAGGASKLQVTKETGTTAPGAGTDLLTNNTSTGFDLNATANTVQTGTLTSTAADLELAAGDRLSVDYANTIQSSAGVVVTVGMVPI